MSRQNALNMSTRLYRRDFYRIRILVTGYSWTAYFTTSQAYEHLIVVDTIGRIE